MMLRLYGAIILLILLIMSVRVCRGWGRWALMCFSGGIVTLLFLVRLIALGVRAARLLFWLLGSLVKKRILGLIKSPGRLRWREDRI